MDPQQISAVFVLRDECASESDTSNEMQKAFQACKQNIFNVKWVREKDFADFDSSKTTFIVFDKFKGKCFEDFSKKKCVRIVGAWCMLVCLIEGVSIPNLTWPLYNVAMRNCVVATSNLSKKEKIEIKNKIQAMSGIYTDSLMQNNTHLVTSSVKTEKYIVAADAGIKLMHPEWVNAVWEKSLSCNIHCDDECFNKYRCLPFHNLTICSTGITSITQREEIEKLVNDNGGKFTAELKISSTDVLVCAGESSTSSAKYKAARKRGEIKCVILQWIIDSVKKGYALPYHDYAVKTSTSTPVKNNVNPNFSMLSTISSTSQLHVSKTTLQETVNISNLSSTPKSIQNLKRKNIIMNQYDDLVDAIDMKQVKIAGSFLDGCSIYLMGFGNEQREKLCKVVNFSGATRYDDITERVTHVIVGNPNSADIKTIQSHKYSCILVTVLWLLESIAQHQPANEENHLFNEKVIAQDEISSPKSKKGLNLLRTNSIVMEQERSVSHNIVLQDENEMVCDVISRYLKPTNCTDEQDSLALLLRNQNYYETKNVPINRTQTESKKQISAFSSGTTSSTLDDETSQIITIFEGFKFSIVGFEDTELSQLKETIESAAGEVVDQFFVIPDFAVLPVFTKNLHTANATKIVNDLWIIECIQNGCVHEILYYHQPFSLHESKPLRGCIVTVSGYANVERNFLRDFIEQLGGVAQEQFARINSDKQNIKASTHLVTLEPSGKKYMAALKWNKPIINKDWLLECYRTKELVPVKNFVVGDVKVPDTSPQNININSPSTSTSAAHENIKVAEHQNIRTQKYQDTTDFMKNYTIPTSIENKEPCVAASDVSKNENSSSPSTPVHKYTHNLTTNASSQVTPVSKIMEQVRMQNLLGTPDCSPMPKPWDHVDTPDTPLGAFIRPNPSPALRKEMLRYLNTLPDWKPPERRMSTPLSEIKQQLWDKICPSRKDEIHPKTLNYEESVDLQTKQCPETPESLLICNKLKQLEDMVKASGGSRRSSKINFQSTSALEVPAAEVKGSQACTVDWDYTVPIFMLSGIDEQFRKEITVKLESLGAIVSELSSYDPKCTHLLCSKPAKNEKTLSCIAAGKWILHTSYINESVKAGRLLNEEEFEFGNIKSTGNILINFDKENQNRNQTISWWRKEITKRGYGAFHDMRAIIVASRRQPIANVIEAGGGIVIDAEPPFDDSVCATHCLLEPKSMSDESLYIPLAKRGIYCVNISYISSFLHKSVQDIKDCILPYYSKYYLRS